MDYRPSNASNRDAGANVSAARSMGNIVDILGEAENIVLGLKALDTSDRPNIFCPPLRIGRPILEPLDSSMEPTPLGPSAFIPKLLQRSSGPALFGGAGIPKWMTTADLQYSQPQQAPSSKQQNNMVPPAPGLHEPNSFDLSLSSLDDTPLSLDYIGDLEAGPALVCSSAVSVSPQGSSGDDEQLKKRRVRKYKEDQWNVRFEDLLKFRAEEGHVMVPHSYPKNQKLAQWVKR
jgi:Helicase associated domain